MTECKFMSSFCVSQTTWGEYDSTRQLSDRINDITLWKKSLEACAEELDTEMDTLTLVSRVITLLVVKSDIFFYNIYSLLFLFSFSLHYIFISISINILSYLIPVLCFVLHLPLSCNINKRKRHK